VQTLCMAEKLDILHSLEHIVKNLGVTATVEMMSELACGEDAGQLSSTCSQQDRLLTMTGLENERKDTEAGESKTIEAGRSELDRDNIKSSTSESTRPRHASAATGQGEAAVGARKSSRCNHKHCRFLTYGMGVGRIL